MAAVRHLELVWQVLKPPTMITWWSLSLCKIWLKSMSSFDNMKLSIFCPFGLKTPIHALRIGIFRGGGISPPKWGVISTKPPNGTPLRESASFEPSSVKIRRRVWPVLINKKINKFVIFHPFAQKPTWTDLHPIWHSRRPRGHRRNQ